MAAKSNSCFWLAIVKQIKELLLVAMFVGQMEPYEEAL
jgi:hypothetical protein